MNRLLCEIWLNFFYVWLSIAICFIICSYFILKKKKSIETLERLISISNFLINFVGFVILISGNALLLFVL